MADEDIQVTPRDPNAVPADSGGGDLPDEVLNMPVMQALFAGSPGAVSDSIEATDTPLGQAIAEHSEALKAAGMGLYRSNDGSLGVVFNQLHISPDDILAADANGTLTQIAPPVAEVERAIQENPDAVLNAQVPGGPALPSGGGGGGGGPVPPAANNQRLATARRNNVLPQGPTDQAQPGAGKILNDILKPVL